MALALWPVPGRCQNSRSHGNAHLQCPAGLSASLQTVLQLPIIQLDQELITCCICLVWTQPTHTHVSPPTFLGKQCHLSDFHFLCNGLFPSGPSGLVPSNTFSGTCAPFPEEQPRGRQMRSCGLFTAYPQGARFPQGCSERCLEVCSVTLLKPSGEPLPHPRKSDLEGASETSHVGVSSPFHLGGLCSKWPSGAPWPWLS